MYNNDAALLKRGTCVDIKITKSWHISIEVHIRAEVQLSTELELVRNRTGVGEELGTCTFEEASHM